MSPAFLVAPVLLYLPTAIGGSAAAGTLTAIWICLAIAVAGVAGTVTLFVLGGERLQAGLKTWTRDGEVAWDSTPLLARLRDKKADREIA